MDLSLPSLERRNVAKTLDGLFLFLFWLFSLIWYPYSLLIAYVTGVKRGRRRENLGAQATLAFSSPSPPCITNATVKESAQTACKDVWRRVSAKVTMIIP